MIIDLMDYFEEVKDIVKTGNVFKIPLEEFTKLQKNYQSCQKRYAIVLCRFLIEHSYTWEAIIGCLVGSKLEDIGKLIWFEHITPRIVGGLSVNLSINSNDFYTDYLPKSIPSLPVQCESNLLILHITLKQLYINCLIYYYSKCTTHP